MVLYTLSIYILRPKSMGTFDDKMLKKANENIILEERLISLSPVQVNLEELRHQAAQNLIVLAGTNPDMVGIPRHLEDKQNQ